MNLHPCIKPRRPCGDGRGGKGADWAAATAPVIHAATNLPNLPPSATDGRRQVEEKENEKEKGGIGTRAVVSDDIIMEAAAADEAAAAVGMYADDASPSGPDVASRCGPYRLHGVISHLGSSPECGHYVAHVCDRPKEKGGWTTYDDEDVKEVCPSAVLGLAQERQCYVAVYVLEEEEKK